ncbi:MAG: GNAT family N-acetyltransferase [Alphaproteobacteria bacterium]
MIRPATPDDRDAVVSIFLETVRSADSFAFDPNTDRAGGQALWFAAGAAVYVADRGGTIAGSCFIKPNQPGLGDHIANAGIMVAQRFKGFGIGRALADFVIQEGRRLGYTGMQFNFVVVSNKPAVDLWLSVGFREAGRIPGAFRHPNRGPTDVLILFRSL